MVKIMSRLKAYLYPLLLGQRIPELVLSSEMRVCPQPEWQPECIINCVCSQPPIAIVTAIRFLRKRQCSRSALWRSFHKTHPVCSICVCNLLVYFQPACMGRLMRTIRKQPHRHSINCLHYYTQESAFGCQ